MISEALSANCYRVEWFVSEQNHKAIEFYTNTVEADVKQDWKVVMLGRKQMEKYLSKASS